MSVAFRRESDEEHKEPRFELPLPAGPNIVTPRGLRLIEAKVAELTGRLSGGEDEDARRQWRYWTTRLSTALVAPPPPADEAAIGSRVRVRMNGAERIIDIVGHDEAEPAAGRLGFAAPLAAALIGAEEGELIDFAGRADAIEVLVISAIPDQS